MTAVLAFLVGLGAQAAPPLVVVPPTTAPAAPKPVDKDRLASATALVELMNIEGTLSTLR